MEKTKKTATKETKTVAKKEKITKKVKTAPIAHSVGRRKSSTARIWLRKGKGNIIVNRKDYKDYFDTEVTRLSASLPLRVYEAGSNFDYEINVKGGGKFGQADAIKLGISRALVEFDKDLKPLFRKHGLLTVDSRLKERKKYGQKAARRKFQFVKR